MGSLTRASMIRQLVNRTTLLATLLILLFLQSCVEGGAAHPWHGRRPRGSEASSRSRSARTLVSESNSAASPSVTNVFEVDRPITSTAPVACTVVLLSYNFANTISSPPVVASYVPDSNCGTEWSSVVLKWKSSVTGIQYDRFAGVWLSGVELLRTTTAEPVGDGVIIEWEVEKDISAYASMLRQNQTVVVSLPNLVSDAYTGVYNTTITATFYAAVPNRAIADFFILPISNPSPFNGSYWFNLQRQGDVKSSNLTIPSNAYEAFLELYVSFHGDDEFWYATSAASPPGPFREVVVSIDGQVVGAVWPAPVIYTGGFDPYLWSPVVGLGAFKLPTYSIDITAFLGRLVDNKPHTFSIDVVNALDFWLLDANLFLSLDHDGARTIGEVTHYSAPAYNVTQTSNATTGTYLIEAARTISVGGYVVSPKLGNTTLSSEQTLQFRQFQNVQSGTYDQLTKTVTRGRQTLVPTGENATVQMESRITSVFPFAMTLSAEGNLWNRSFVGDLEVIVNSTVDGQHQSRVYRDYLSDSQDVKESTPAMLQTYNYYSLKSDVSCFNREVEVDSLGHLASDKSNAVCIDPPTIT